MPSPSLLGRVVRHTLSAHRSPSHTFPSCFFTLLSSLCSHFPRRDASKAKAATAAGGPKQQDLFKQLMRPRLPPVSFYVEQEVRLFKTLTVVLCA